MFRVGDVVGNYTVLAPLRSGGMADLFLARREGAAGFRRLVAVKVVHARHAGNEDLVRMFLDEALISARIDHPNVVHVEDLGEHGDSYFLVMEYVHGCSLSQLLKVLGRSRRRLSPHVAVAIASRIAEGLHAAHETTDDRGELVKLVHRDVSPQNILLSHKGHVKLIDFGVAKADMRAEETSVAMLKGKVRYMAPEQATGGDVDRRTDIYSLGIVLWEMLTMQRLFVGKTEFEILKRVRSPVIQPPSEFVPEIMPELDKVVLSALSPNPEGRPATAKGFRRMLVEALPRAALLDSAHLADLIRSNVGDQLEQVRTELPREVSLQLRAEQLRAALAGFEMESQEATTASFADMMTFDSDVDFVEETSELSDASLRTTSVGGRLEAWDADAPPAANSSMPFADGEATFVTRDGSDDFRMSSHPPFGDSPEESATHRDPTRPAENQHPGADPLETSDESSFDVLSGLSELREGSSPIPLEPSVEEPSKLRQRRVAVAVAVLLAGLLGSGLAAALALFSRAGSAPPPSDNPPVSSDSAPTTAIPTESEPATPEEDTPAALMDPDAGVPAPAVEEPRPTADASPSEVAALPELDAGPQAPVDAGRQLTRRQRRRLFLRRQARLRALRERRLERRRRRAERARGHR